MKNRIVVLLPLAWLLFQPYMFGQKMAERLSEKQKKEHIKLHKVLVMPARADLVKQGIKGSEGITKAADELAVKFTNEAEQEVRSSGLEVTPSPFSEAQLQANSDRRAQLLRLQNQFDEVQQQVDYDRAVQSKMVWNRIGEVRGANRKLNDGSAKIADDAMSDELSSQVDALVFPRIHGNIRTGGERAKSGLVDSFTKSQVDYSLSIVSSQTGEVLAIYSLMHTSSLKKQMEKPVMAKVGAKIRKTFVGHGKKR